MDAPDWRVTQKWISVEVPWKAEFEQKFRIVLKKESPVVLVLSQLDDRYFDGLQGQYSFRLQFRLHEVDSPGEEDYILRSHGNYLMERSVVTELKSLRAGTYSVFVMVVADRDTSALTVEDVVKQQCRRKTDNEKLAQVGMSYDIAHSKGQVHLESQAAARKAQDKAKAREARIATRRKNWEKRHLSREIVRKQEKKNMEKRARKDAKIVAEAKEKIAKEPKDQAIQTEDVKEVVIVNEDKAIQTEEPTISGAESDQTVAAPTPQLKETDKAVQTDDFSSTDSEGTPETPKSSIATSSRPPVLRTYSSMQSRSGVPPPPPPPSAYPPQYIIERKHSSTHHTYPRGPPQRGAYVESDGESSASPISDFDDMYSDDDPTLKPRPINTTGSTPSTSKPRGKDSDEEDEIEPWNAVCIVGFRVYSKDEGLEVKIFQDGDEEDEQIVIVEKDDEGTDGDVEDEVEREAKTKNEDGEKKEAETVDETKVAEQDKENLPIRAKEGEELVLVDGEKKAIGLCTEGSDVVSLEALGEESKTASSEEKAGTETAEKPDLSGAVA
jgi:hypothetical protein